MRSPSMNSIIFAFFISVLTTLVTPAMYGADYLSESPSTSQSPDQTVRFIYQDEPLVNIIYQMAELKGINIIVPSGSAAITAKITMHNEEPMRLGAAWQMFLTI